MDAMQLRARLEKAGFAPTDFSEPSFHEDGFVQISDKVHIQVPLDSGSGLNVVREGADDTFVFYASRPLFDDLLTDLREALREEAAEAAS